MVRTCWTAKPVSSSRQMTSRQEPTCSYPDMREKRTHGALAVHLEMLRHNGNNSHDHSYEAVMVDSDPDDVEPGQAALGGPPRVLVSSTAFREPIQWPHPRHKGVQLPEEVLLVMQRWCDILTHEAEEGRDGEGLVTVGYDSIVDGMVVKDKLKEIRGGVYWYHEQNPDDAAVHVSIVTSELELDRTWDVKHALFLLYWFRVIKRMHPYQKETEGYG